MALTQASTADALQVFYMDLERKHLAPLWTATADLLPREPKTKVLPFLWRWSDLWALAQRSGELIPIERGGERRVLAHQSHAVGCGSVSAARRTGSRPPPHPRCHSLDHQGRRLLYSS